MNKRLIKYLFVLQFIIVSVVSCFSQTNNADYVVQTLYTHNFTKFIKWENKTNDVFVIAVFENSPILPYFKEMSKTKKIQDKKINIITISSLKNLPPCEIIYLDEQYTKTEIPFDDLNKLKNVLVITNSKTMPEGFSCINFQKINDTYKFEISLKNLGNNMLEASSMLLNLAIKIYR